MRRTHAVRRRKPNDEPTPLNTDCTHRGEITDRRISEACGHRGRKFSVYACTEHGECSIQADEDKLQSCIVCLLTKRMNEKRSKPIGS